MVVSHNTEYEDFVVFLNIVIGKLRPDAQERNEYYLGQTGAKLEKDIVDMMNSTKEGRSFNAELISGQKFPDIIAYMEGKMLLELK